MEWTKAEYTLFWLGLEDRIRRLEEALDMHPNRYTASEIERCKFLQQKLNPLIDGDQKREEEEP